MSNSHEQSLNEDVVFSPVYESSPEFLHCERERRALEGLLSEGAEAFPSKLKLERLGDFLSAEEVTQICGWVQDYRCSQASPEDEQEEARGEHLSSSYCPAHTDNPLPSLQLGWPEGKRWPDAGHTLVYTNPPVPGAPAIREVVRRMIQGAQKVVAVVTDKLTDSAVIGDLHGAASRGVPVYVVLNERSVQGGFTSPRLIHQNIRVRVLGGKTFCSRDGKMVVGELKENFLLVDLDAVMVGSYSLTWTDAHLHRQLVTVLSGPVVDCFDNEFRMLYAASSPMPESYWVHSTLSRMENVFLQSKHTPKSLPLDILSEDEMWPLYSKDPIDWEALGVIKRDQFPDDPFNQPGELVGPSLAPPPLFERWTTMDKVPLSRRVEFQRCVPPLHEEQRKQLLVTETRHFPGSENLLWNKARPEGIIYKPQSWQRIYETESMKQLVQSNIHKTRTHPVEETISSPYHQQINEENGQVHFNLKKDSDYGVWSRPLVTGPGRSYEKGSQFSKKPLILMMPVPETAGSSDFSDVLKGLKTESNSQENPLRSNLITTKGISASMQDLGFLSIETDQQDKTFPAWRTHTNAQPRLTPAQTLMKTRNEEVKATASRLPNIFTNPYRLHTSSFDLTRDREKPPQQSQERHLEGGH